MCEHENYTFTEGQKCCTDCGSYLGERVYITSYNRSFSYRRQPIYSRQKRFYSFITSIHQPYIMENMEDIMTLFGRLEFFWNSSIHRNSRKYFYNRFVILVFILDTLNINTDGMRTLKDKERVEIQMNAMNEILTNSAF